MEPVELAALSFTALLVLIASHGGIRLRGLTPATLRRRLAEEHGFEIAQSLAIAAFGILLSLAAYSVFRPLITRLVRSMFSQIG